MEKRSTISNKTVPGNISFSVGNKPQEILKLEGSGKITWFLNGEEIIVKDRSVLAIALLDVVIKLTGMEYDYSKLDKQLYNEYKTFLETRHKIS